MKSESIKHAMYFGLLLGVIFIANFLLQTYKGFIFSILHLSLTVIIPYLAFLITKKYRDQINNGSVSYGQAFWYGVQLFFYAAFISSAFKYVYFQFLNPNYLKDLFNQSMALLSNMPVLMTDEMIETARRMLTPLNMSMQFLWINVLVGFFVSLFVAGFVKREKSIFKN